MECENQTALMHFVLLGIPYPPELYTPLFFFLVCIYLLTLVSNLLVMLSVINEPQLHKPMYWFLCYLSVLDITISTVVVPKLIATLLDGGGIISFGGCVSQVFILHFVGCAEGFLYIVMAYDRYLAICRPLHYGTIMNSKACLWLAMGTWMGGSLHSAMETALTFHLPYGQDNKVSYIFCDMSPVLKLACADTSLNEMVTFVNVGILGMVCFLLILTSYVYIVSAILRIRSAEGRQRAFSTCTTHVIIVMTCYIPLSFNYLRPGAQDPLGGVVAVFYTIVTPFLNPVIYALRNKEMKNAILKLRHWNM